MRLASLSLICICSVHRCWAFVSPIVAFPRVGSKTQILAERSVASRSSPQAPQRRMQRHDTRMNALGGVSGVAFSQIGAVLVLSAVVAIHEAGHFVAARSQGIRVKVMMGSEPLQCKLHLNLRVAAYSAESEQQFTRSSACWFLVPAEFQHWLRT